MNALETFLSIMAFYNAGTIVNDSFIHYFGNFMPEYPLTDNIKLSSFEESNNSIKNYFWGICTANREEITKKVRVTYAPR